MDGARLPAYVALSHPARGLLIEFARQYTRDNNGRLLGSYAYLEPRGWASKDVITRAKRELIEAGFIFETAKGQRPNKASWYAITWYALDKLDGYDAGAAAAFQRGAYRENEAKKNACLSPSGGRIAPAVGPSGGLETPSAGPSGGPIEAISLKSLAHLAGASIEVTICPHEVQQSKQGDGMKHRTRSTSPTSINATERSK